MMGLLIAKLIIFEEQNLDKRTNEQNFENELISDKCQLSVGMIFCGLFVDNFLFRFAF